MFGLLYFWDGQRELLDTNLKHPCSKFKVRTSGLRLGQEKNFQTSTLSRKQTKFEHVFLAILNFELCALNFGWPRLFVGFLLAAHRHAIASLNTGSLCCSEWILPNRTTESCAYISRSVYSYLVLVLALGYLGEWEV